MRIPSRAAAARHLPLLHVVRVALAGAGAIRLLLLLLRRHHAARLEALVRAAVLHHVAARTAGVAGVLYVAGHVLLLLLGRHGGVGLAAGLRGVHVG